jgi:hypothetical protein
MPSQPHTGQPDVGSRNFSDIRQGNWVDRYLPASPAPDARAAALLLAQAGPRAMNFDDPADCLAKFNAHRWLGWMVLAGILLSSWFG